MHKRNCLLNQVKTIGASQNMNSWNQNTFGVGNFHLQTFIYRTLTTVEISEVKDEETTNNKVTRSKSQQATVSSASGAAEEVDGPRGWGYDPSASGFIRTPDGYVIVFTDGACSQNGKVGAKAGIGVWFNHNNPL